jgi:phosphatidylglycerophosphate synthase
MLWALMFTWHTTYMLLTSNEHHDQLSEFREKVIDYNYLFKPPTLVTLGSLALVLNGSRNIDTVNGVNQIVLGRCGDLVDGYLARLLDQSSDIGALVDTAADKVGMAAILGAAAYKHAIPPLPLSVITSKQLLNVGLTSLTAINHPKQSFRPNQFGKYAMAADTAACVGYLYSNALKREHPDKIELQQGFELLGRIGFAAGSTLSVPATLEYAERAFRK